MGGILRQPAHRGWHRTHVGLQLRCRQCSGKGHALFLQQRELPRPPSLNSVTRDKITSEGALCRFKSPSVVRCFSVKVNRHVEVIAKLVCKRIVAKTINRSRLCILTSWTRWLCYQLCQLGEYKFNIDLITYFLYYLAETADKQASSSSVSGWTSIYCFWL